MLEEFKIVRRAGPGTYMLWDVFWGLGTCRDLWRIYGGREKFNGVLLKTKLRVTRDKRLFFIDVKRRCVVIDEGHLKGADRRTLYLDCVHELVHIKQLRDGRELFDRRYDYVDRPTELEAYRATVPIAKRLKMSRRQIINYLKLPWTDAEQHKRLVRNVLGD